jgi:hypothetical protein
MFYYGWPGLMGSINVIGLRRFLHTMKNEQISTVIFNSPADSMALLILNLFNHVLTENRFVP